MIEFACNPQTWETEAEGSQVSGQHGLHTETQSKREREKKKKKKNLVNVKLNIYSHSYTKKACFKINKQTSKNSKLFFILIYF